MSAVDDYLTELSATLRVSGRQRVRIEGEIRDHLEEATSRRAAAGADDIGAANQAIASFGPAALLATQFNAEAGAQATRRAPVIAFASGVAVVVGFVFAASTQPASGSRVLLVSQVCFFGAVIALQVAVVAGACALARAAALWRSPAVGVASRVHVRRCTSVSVGALVVAASGWSLTLAVAFATSAQSNGVTLAIGVTVMIVAASAGCTSLAVQRINDTDESGEQQNPETGVLGWGDAVVALVRGHPVVSCAAAAIVGVASAMAHAETTVTGALPWGVAQAGAVVAGFVIAGPVLDLRRSRSADRFTERKHWHVRLH